MNLREKIERAAIVIDIDTITIEDGNISYSGYQSKNRFGERINHLEGVIPFPDKVEEALLLLQGVVDIEMGAIKMDLQNKFECTNILVLREKPRYERNRN